MVKVYKLTENMFFIKMVSGEELISSLKKALTIIDKSFGIIFGLGALKKANIGYFRANKYHVVSVKAKNNVLEVGILNGNFVKGPDGLYYPHLHIVIGEFNGETYSGHVLEGCIVHPLLEIFVNTLPATADVIKEFSHRWIKA